MSLNARRAFHRQRMGHRDANHGPIATGLAMLGHLVIDLAGVGGGVSDLWVKRLGSRIGVWLELKTLKGAARLSQLKFKAKVEARGELYAVARTLEQALEALP